MLTETLRSPIRPIFFYGKNKLSVIIDVFINFQCFSFYLFIQNYVFYRKAVVQADEEGEGVSSRTTTRTTTTTATATLQRKQQ